MARNSNNKGQTNRPNPVNLEGWLAANQPRLHPTKRKVLQVLAGLCADAQWVSSSEIREAAGLSQQLLNRHLRGLQSQGLVQVSPMGPGLPLNVRPTATGLRALGLRGPGRSSAAQPEPQKADSPPEQKGQLGNAGQRLYQALSPYLKNLDEDGFASLIKNRAAELSQSHLASQGPASETSEAQFSQTAPSEKAETILAETPEETGPWAAFPAAQEPPRLGPAEAALEQRLEQTANPDYRGIAWHKRTKMLSSEWNQARRRRLGYLNTYFNDFGPRWERPDWTDFQTARRQADSRGARYEDWVAAQFDRLSPEGKSDVPPQALHGQEAMDAYLSTVTGSESEKVQRLGAPPYSTHTFDLNEPQHVTYAEQVLEEIGELARRVFGDDPDGPIRLVQQALKSDNLPMAALDLRPQWKEKLLAEKRFNGTNGSNSASQPKPAVII